MMTIKTREDCQCAECSDKRALATEAVQWEIIGPDGHGGERHAESRHDRHARENKGADKGYWRTTYTPNADGSVTEAVNSAHPDMGALRAYESLVQSARDRARRDNDS